MIEAADNIAAKETKALGTDWYGYIHRLGRLNKTS